jgi:hypothetical protein
VRHRPFAPTGNDDASLADWAEACLHLLQGEELSRADLARLLANEPLDELDFGSAAEVEDEAVETLVMEDSRIDRILTAVERRRTLAPDVYPFRIESDLVAYEASDAGYVYLFLLWCCVPGTPFRGENGDFDSAEDAFDRIAALAVRNLLGPTSVLTMLFARKRANDDSDDPVVRPTSFPAAIRRVRQLMLTHGLEIPPDDPDGALAEAESLPARTYQDGGVDVLSWRVFRDDRPAFPVALAQCTLQTNWRMKTRDIVAELWNAWVAFPTPFQRMLLIPWAASHDGLWADKNRMAGLIIDRMRLCELLELAIADVVELSREELQPWLDRERRQYVWQEAAA